MARSAKPDESAPPLRGTAPRKPSLLDRLPRPGWQLTAQRRVVAEVMEGDHVHMTAEQVFEAAVARLPEVSRATVYNTLNQLRDLGEVREYALDLGPKRYDPNALHHHHHLICDHCGAIRDVTAAGENALKLSASDRGGFELSGVEIAFHGLCPDCRSKSR